MKCSVCVCLCLSVCMCEPVHKCLGVCTDTSKSPDIITHGGCFTHTSLTSHISQLSRRLELLSGFHLWLNGKARNTMRSWSNVSVIQCKPRWWYWAAVNYRVLLQFPNRSQLSLSASLSSKLAIVQPSMDAHALHLPAASRTVWKWDCVPISSCWSWSIAQVPLILTNANNPNNKSVWLKFNANCWEELRKNSFVIVKF